ncbi:RNA-binding domain-containing protein [uncultured Duncaniella sp.]|uniref:RNA-binding domain-containing protein n=1 Tax=uncultured Duncaniella sp. TaxID=2768039 RepID=UPI002609A174|nr:RNA-binding domain-containing protein [uncultured Duncaniella sp.]
MAVFQINIEDILNKRRVESNRIEFKRSWNPSDIYQTICAFANDFENLGGGYILVGVEQDENGIAKRPVKGIELDAIDKIQKDMVGYDAKIKPAYVTRTEVVEIDGRHILAIWAPARNNRPYSVPENVVAKHVSAIKYYIRSKSSTIAAKDEVLQELFDMANNTPFDERGNPNISIDDISPILVFDHLKRIDSKLTQSFDASKLMDTLDAMELLTGPTENRVIKNVAAMMFCPYPEKFFPVTQAEIVIFPEGSEENPDEMIEVPTIKGPIPYIIRETLSYLKLNVIKQKIIKPQDQAESIKITNYPYQAFEEGVVNAFYHRNYQEREPVEITIEPDRVEILSHAGPDRSISDEDIRKAKKLKTRKYRNRRLGDFLKELDLSEGRATGIPTIQKHLRLNGSKAATIETDEHRTFFQLTIPCHTDFGSIASVNGHPKKNSELEQILGQSFVQVHEIVYQSIITQKEQLEQILGQMFVQVWDKSKFLPNVPRLSQSTIDLLCLLKNESMGANALNSAIDYGETYELKRKILLPLISLGYIEMTSPDKPTSAKQKYRLTDKGIKLF